MKYKTKPSRRVFMIFAYGLMIVIAIICIAPLWHVLMASVSNPTLATNSKGLILWPLGNLDFKAYEIILGYARLWQGYGNTLLYIIGQCMVTGISTVIAGYVFSRKRFFYRNTFMMIISFTMLFNGGMIPTYMVIRNIGLIDTPLAMIIPQALSVFNILIMRTSMQNISDALEEAARIDGASDFKIMFKIILPLSKATFAVIMLFTIVMKWNDYMSALLYLPTKTDLYPLQMVLRSILITTSQDLTSASDLANSVSLYKKSVEYAVIVVSTLPILCVYPFVQKYFVTGITIGAVKS
ncbi:MAG: carbohydrate ABC transporter permease [Clostridiales bacterium]|nr:carbohydrate ABC transporter permease [Clostridiales bacterium]